MIIKRRSLAIPLVTASALLVGLLPASAASSPAFQHIGTVTEPNVSLNDGFSSFDISFVDSKRDVYYLADRAGFDGANFIRGRIVSVDADDGSSLPDIGTNAFAGNFNNAKSGFAACSELPRDPRNGPNGVATDDAGFIWVGDGNHATGTECSGKTFASGTSTVKVFDPTTGAMVANIDNGGNRRADELAFARVGDDGRVLMGNPEEVKPGFPFMTLLDVDSRSILGKVVYDAQPTSTTPKNAVPPTGHGWDSSLEDTGGSGGLEQDVFDSEAKVFLLNVPSTTLNPGGEIDAISPNATAGHGTVVRVMPLDSCNGSGLALSEDRLVVQCGDSLRVVNKDTGAEIARFAEGAGADEIWFNPGDGNVYQGMIGPPVGSTAGVGILELRHLNYLGIVPTEAHLGTHSVAAGGKNNRIFYPTGEGSVAAHNAGNGGIAMFHRDDREPGPGGDGEN